LAKTPSFEFPMTLPEGVNVLVGNEAGAAAAGFKRDDDEPAGAGTSGIDSWNEFELLFGDKRRSLMSWCPSSSSSLGASNESSKAESVRGCVPTTEWKDGGGELGIG
jgi:hypothetical protein